jgi:hypothetical protein
MDMRRPLFGNGIPQNLPGNPIPVPVLLFDTKALDPAQVYAVTLFCWAWQNLPTPTLANEPNLQIGVVSNAQPVVAVAAVDPAVFVDLKTPKPYGKPVLVLDRYMMRGDQQLFAQNAGAVTATSCWLYGYFEVAGESPVSEPFRPLQPAALVAPFSPSPTLIFPVGPAATEYKTAHKLDPDYLDAVTLNVLTAARAVYGSLPSAFVRLPGGLKMPLPMPPTMSVGTINCSPFDGIPMRAPSAADNLIDIGFDDSGDVANASALSGFGRFRRY